MSTKNPKEELTTKPSAFLDEIKQLKAKQDKSNLYLTILEQDLVSLSDLNSSLASDIDSEVKEFILKRFKEANGAINEATANFSETEVKALKFIADKFMT